MKFNIFLPRNKSLIAFINGSISDENRKTSYTKLSYKKLNAYCDGDFQKLSYHKMNAYNIRADKCQCSAVKYHVDLNYGANYTFSQLKRNREVPACGCALQHIGETISNE